MQTKVNNVTTSGVVAQQINSNYIIRITIRKELSRQGLTSFKYTTVLLRNPPLYVMYVLYILYVRFPYILRILYTLRTILYNLSYYSLLYGSTDSILDRTSINQLATSNSSPSSYNIVLKASVISRLQHYIFIYINPSQVA